MALTKIMLKGAKINIWEILETQTKHSVSNKIKLKNKLKSKLNVTIQIFFKF